MLSRDCDGCSQLRVCNKRYEKVSKGGRVYCPDGTAHLVDEDANQKIVFVGQHAELLQIK